MNTAAASELWRSRGYQTKENAAANRDGISFYLTDA
jgi:hypothetical protein